MEEHDIIKIRLRSPKWDASQTLRIKDMSVDPTESVESAENVRTTQHVARSIVYNISGNFHCVFKVTIAEFAPEISRYLADTSGSSRWISNEQLHTVRLDS
jgi:hypothetical protein